MPVRDRQCAECQRLRRALRPARRWAQTSGCRVRLFRGFSLNLFGNYALVRDQITLARGDLTQDQVLLRQREVATDYRFFVSGGISYRFGSIFNNVVNPRFDGTTGGFFFF